jgi:two-component system cell cycle response regulator
VLIREEAADPSEALRTCDRRMYARKHSRRATAAVQTNDVLLAALAACNAELGEHVGAVAVTAQRVGVELGLSGVWLRELGYAAELHDIGKVALPDSLLSKPGPLGETEWEFVQRHTIIGDRILAAAPAMAEVGKIVRSTHERYDGAGYPDRISGEQIPLQARIICVCDAYDPMTSRRPYRQPATHAEALVELRRCAAGQFDPRVVDAFVALYADCPPETPGRPALSPAPAMIMTPAASAA